VQALTGRLGASMARTVYALITATVNDAIRAGRLGSSRLSGIALPVKTVRAEIIFPSHVQLAKLVETMPEEYRLTIWLMRGCGLRICEALAVRADDFDGTRLRVHEQLLADGGLGPLKHRKPRDHRDVPVPAYVGELVEGKEPGYLFEPLPRRNYHRRFASARKAGGLPAEFTPHTLRHIFASVALANGVPITDVSKWLGHRNINTTYAIYGHLVPSSWDAARAVLDAEYREWAALPARVAVHDDCRRVHADRLGGNLCHRRMGDRARLRRARRLRVDTSAPGAQTPRGSGAAVRHR
jgi:integrase